MSRLLRIRKDTEAGVKCDKDQCCGVNPAEFRLINGDETTLYCYPGFADEVASMLKINPVGVALIKDGAEQGVAVVRCGRGA